MLRRRRRRSGMPFALAVVVVVDDDTTQFSPVHFENLRWMYLRSGNTFTITLVLQYLVGNDATAPSRLTSGCSSDVVILMAVLIDPPTSTPRALRSTTSLSTTTAATTTTMTSLRCRSTKMSIRFNAKQKILFTMSTERRKESKQERNGPKYILVIFLWNL